MSAFPENPKQILPRQAYTSEEWFERERATLLRNTWHFACMALELKETGDFKALNLFGYPIFIIRSGPDEIAAFHNLCSHRGTELVEGTGNCGKTLVCPYHRWTYALDGRLRGLPDRAECFEQFDRESHGLKPIGLAIFKEMVFVTLNEANGGKFDEWITPLKGHEWPHDISGSGLKASEPFIYEIACNWKVFHENAIDGYHLAYLHENTLGGPKATSNVWECHGTNMAWYSTERDKIKSRIPLFVEKQATLGAATVPGADVPGYAGVYMLFPTTIVTPSPWSLTISAIRPISAQSMQLVAQTFVPDSWFSAREHPRQAPGYDPATNTIRSANWTKPPLETGDFQTEDIWVCEKMQRSLASPAYSVGQLASGSGGEAALEVFQRHVADQMGLHETEERA
ncbi:MAG: SRPBCC family protein [Pseudomonadota bacterium]